MNGHAADADDLARPLPLESLLRLEEDFTAVGETWEPLPVQAGEVGRTMFDTTASQDNTITVLLPREQIDKVHAQATVRIASHPDGKTYLGVVVAGPFAEPDGLRGDAPLMVTTTVRGAVFMPRYHGRVQVEIVSEQLADGGTAPPRRRPLPNSPVHVLDAEQTAAVLGTGGNVRFGTAIGHDDITVGVSSTNKGVFPRHTAILGTTGGGKSNTVAGLVARLQQAGVAVILLDTEGEYTRLNEPNDDPKLLAALGRAGLAPNGVADTALYHLVGRDTANPGHTSLHPYTLHFDELSPYAVANILDLNDAQEERYSQAYGLCKRMLWDLHIFPRTAAEEREASEVDEFERGYPRMTLDHMYDVVRRIDKRLWGEPFARPTSHDFQGQEELFKRIVDPLKTSHPSSWRAVLGRLGRLQRLKVFDQADAIGLPYADMATASSVSIVDLSGTDSPQVNNLAIAELLRGVHEYQEAEARRIERTEEQLTPVVVIIEEAHEFLSAQRVEKMQHLFEQVARIARRGRKRWLGLVFVTQLPQHLPDEVFGLVNNYVLHKISDAGVISRLRRSVSGIDDSLWQRLPGLAPGQAIVSFTGLTRPLLVAIDPAPAKLRLTD